MDKAKAHTQS